MKLDPALKYTREDLESCSLATLQGYVRRIYGELGEPPLSTLARNHHGFLPYNAQGPCRSKLSRGDVIEYILSAYSAPALAADPSLATLPKLPKRSPKTPPVAPPTGAQAEVEPALLGGLGVELLRSLQATQQQVLQELHAQSQALKVQDGLLRDLLRAQQEAEQFSPMQALQIPRGPVGAGAQDLLAGKPSPTAPPEPFPSGGEGRAPVLLPEAKEAAALPPAPPVEAARPKVETVHGGAPPGPVFATQTAPQDIAQEVLVLWTEGKCNDLRRLVLQKAAHREALMAVLAQRGCTPAPGESAVTFLLKVLKEAEKS